MAFLSFLFMKHRRQAVRPPEAVAFPEGKPVDVATAGNTHIITPAGSCSYSWFDGPCASADFMRERDQPAHQARQAL